MSSETRPSLPRKPGVVARHDYAYQRKGTRTLFLFCEPPAGWPVVVTEQRTRQDFAQQRNWLVDARYPEATVVRVGLDHLNTHKPASLYETFAPEEARRIAKKLEFPYTPTPGSWLNMAALAFSVLSQQCLDRRIPDAATLIREVQAYEARRNAVKAKSTWRFTSEHARVKLHRLSPAIPQN